MSFSSNDILDSKDLAFLHDLLGEISRERDIPAGSEQEKSIADQLINWFLFGIHDKPGLKAMLDPMEQPQATPAAT